MKIIVAAGHQLSGRLSLASSHSLSFVHQDIVEFGIARKVRHSIHETFNHEVCSC